MFCRPSCPKANRLDCLDSLAAVVFHGLSRVAVARPAFRAEPLLQLFENAPGADGLLSPGPARATTGPDDPVCGTNRVWSGRAAREGRSSCRKAKSRGGARMPS